MIIVKLIGGLGNQLFQYAAGRHLAQLHQTQLLLDTSFLSLDAKGAYTQRKFELNVFDLPVKIANEAELSVFKTKKDSALFRTVQRKLPILFSTIYVAESSFNYHKEFLSYPKNTYLDGFWQSELYFKASESIIRNDLTFNDNLNEENKQWLKKIEISAHLEKNLFVRRRSRLFEKLFGIVICTKPPDQASRLA